MHEAARLPADKLELAATYRWENPSCTWAEVAEYVGVDPATLYRWRQTELWQVKHREVVARDQDDELLREARQAMKIALANGDGKLALEIYRGAGFMSHETININTGPDPLKEFLDDLSADRIETDAITESAQDLP